MSQFDPLFPIIFDPMVMEQPRPDNFVDPGILYPQLPSAVKSFNRRYTPGNQFQRQLSNPVYNALRNYDMRRVEQGKPPLTEEKAAIASTAAEQNRQVTPEPDRSFLGDIGNDLTTLVTSIPRLPGQLVTEAMRLGTLPKEMAEIQKTRGAGNQLGQYLQLPGINLIPGTYTASNLLTGNTDELTEHPLFTALDVLPYAGKAAKATKVAKATEAAEVAAARELTRTSGIPTAPRVPNPIKAVLTNRLDSQGNLIRSSIGKGVDAGADLFGRTKIGQVAADTWGPRSRQLSRMVADTNKSLREDFSPVGPATSDPTSNFVRQVHTLSERHPSITEADRINITKVITNPVDAAGNPISINDMGFNGPQLAYAQELSDLSARSRILAMVNAADDELANREWFGSEEVFTHKQARKLDKWDQKLYTYKQRADMRQSAVDQLKLYNDRTQQPTITVAGNTFANPHYTPQLDNLIDSMKPLRRSQGMIKSVLDDYTAKNYKSAASKIRKLAKTKKWQSVLGDPNDLAAALDILDRMAEQADIKASFNKYTSRGLKNYENTISRIKSTVQPARFGEMQQGKLQEIMRKYVTHNFAGDPLFTEYLRHVDNGNYSSLVAESGMDLSDFYTLENEASQTIAAMKQAGADPVFLHRVTPEGARGTAFPAVLDKRLEPSSLKTRNNIDVTPYVPDLQIAMSHQGLEFLNRRYAEELVTRIDQTWGIDLSELRSRYVDEANLAKQANPLLDINHYIDERIRKDGWVKYDPESFAPWRRGSSSSVTDVQTMRMVPGEIKRNLDRMHKPPKIVAALDPILGAFRTSVLALSPRWLVNNIIGGAMLLLAETADPIRTVRFLGEARRMVKSGDMHAIPGMPEKGAFDISPEDIQRLTNKTSDADKMIAIRNYAAGRWIRDVWDDTQAQKAAGKIRNGFGKVVQKSYDFNTAFDDFYRALAYLTGEDKALVKGLSKQEAEHAGIATARKVMQNWDEITPIERTVLRYIFPFYGFMQHIARYVMRYPIDHPWRTAILGSFARNEMEDMGSGLPERFLSMAFLGEMDENGNKKAISFGGANPFAAVSDMYTMGGLLGSMNPLISSFAESMGLDPTTGTTSLYPGYTYNPETGRVEAGQSNYFTTLAGNIFPIPNVINKTLFDNKEFVQLMKTNPDAAGRMLQAQTGLPILFRNINVPEETMKAELARIEAQDKAKATMLRTGNYDIANQYPGLNSYLNTIMEQPDLEQYKEPQPRVSNPIQALMASYSGQVNTPVAGNVSGSVRLM